MVFNQMQETLTQARWRMKFARALNCLFSKASSENHIQVEADTSS